MLAHCLRRWPNITPALGQLLNLTYKINLKYLFKVIHRSVIIMDIRKFITAAVPLDKTLPDPRKCDTRTESRAFSAANTAVQILSGNLTSQSRK